MTLAEILKRNLIEVGLLANAVTLPARRLRDICISAGVAVKIGGRWHVRRDDFRNAMPDLWQALIERAAEIQSETNQTTKTTRTTVVTGKTANRCV
jgi:hypothetical protein